MQPGWLVCGLAAAAALAACGGGDDVRVVERVVEVPAQAMVLAGTGEPAEGAGQDGQFYLDTQAYALYGPRANGAWPRPPLILRGPAGPQGAPGQNGADGQDGQKGADGQPGQPGSAGQVGAPGASILSGAGVPPASAGRDGDYYLDLTATTLYGPKAGGAWPAAGVVLAGAPGAVGPTGPQGPQGPIGQTGPSGSDGAAGPQGPPGPGSIQLQWSIPSNSAFGLGQYYLWPQGPNLLARNPVVLPRSCTQARFQVSTFAVPNLSTAYSFSVMRTPGPALFEDNYSELTAFSCSISGQNAQRYCDISAPVTLNAGDAIEVWVSGNDAFNSLLTSGSWALSFSCE